MRSKDRHAREIDIVTRLVMQLSRGSRLGIVQVADHGPRAIWMGVPVAMDFGKLQEFDEMIDGIVSNGTEETEAMWKFVTPATSAEFLSRKFGQTGH